jgi:hypothetical protein
MTTHTTSLHGRGTTDVNRASQSLATLAAALFALLLCSPSLANAATRWVNDDAATYVPPGMSCKKAGYATIQAAVTAASPGDLIKVCQGKYVENVVITTSNLTILGTAGAAATMVRAATSNHVFVVAATGVTIRGFTIIPAGVADPDIGINVAIDGATGLRVLENVIFRGRIGINLGCVSAGSIISSNTLTGQTDAGINIDTCEAPPFPGSHSNSIQHNIACALTPTASIALGGSSDNNRIEHNVATTISVFGSGNVVRYNTTQAAIVNNGSGSTLNNNLFDAGVCPPNQ